VVTIYRTPTKGYTSFTVVHYNAAGQRCRRTFPDYALAHGAAKETVLELAGGEVESLLLTGRDLLAYQEAKKALLNVGISLDVAALQYARAVQVLGSPQVLEAVEAHMRDRRSTVQPKLVAQVVKELLESKAEKGRSELYRRDLRVRLERVAVAFSGPLANVTPTGIDDYLRSLNVSARTRNNFRSVIGTLIRFGQQRGYVARDHPGVSTVEKSSSVPSDVQVFTPDEMRRLLDHAKRELVPALVIGAFGGVRSEELKRLGWEDVKLRQGHIEIRGANAKTRVRRLIPIQDNLKAWLVPVGGEFVVQAAAGSSNSPRQ
jgi:hypothetical protein